MSLRYEVTPGAGLVARHADSLVWVGDQISPETWEAIGAVLDLEPGTDPSGADTADQLRALDEALAQDPTAIFAALIISGGQAQGILRGPVTVRNRDEIAPATGYEQYGITVPFPMSESVYVGNVNTSANAPGISDMLDLDAGIVPGGGAWAHPVSGGRRHSGSTGTHGTASAATGSLGTAGALGAAGAAGAAGVAGAAAVGRSDRPAEQTEEPPAEAASEQSAEAPVEPPAPVGPLAADQPDEPQDATMQYDPMADSEDSGLGWPQPEPPQPASQQPARPVSDWIPSDSPADVPPPGAPSAAPPTGELRPDVRADAPLPPVEGSGTGWAPGFGAAGVAGAGSATGAAATAGPAAGFTPAPDYERVDLQSSFAEPAQPLPPIDTPASAPASPAGPGEAPQPSPQNAGVIVFDDGSTFSLDRDYVIGRRPEKDPRVLSGQASPLTVVDPDTVLSSAHALVTRRGDRVFLQDLGSLNGSHTAAPGETDWTRLGAHEEVQIVPGTRLLFGWTVATYSGGHQQS